MSTTAPRPHPPAHAVHRDPDLADVRVAGVRHLRYPLPLLSRLRRVRASHTSAGSDHCPTCRVPAPCPTAKELDV
jgi:hypothetical protein